MNKCVQCGKELKEEGTLKHSYNPAKWEAEFLTGISDDWQGIYCCHNPACPNFSLYCRKMEDKKEVE